MMTKSKAAKRRSLIIMLILSETVAMVSACFAVYRIHDIRAEKKSELALKNAEMEAQRKAEEAGSWNLLLVNPWNKMPDDMSVETAEVENGYVVDSRIRDELAGMLADCRAAGYSPQIISTFRTRSQQQYLYDHTANKEDTAYPGTSEHECGLAADIIDADSAGWADPLVDSQEDMPAQKWLMEHCADYGFILRYPRDKEDITGIIYEPWHYRYVGKEHAAAIMQSGVCLEEYLRDEYGAGHTTGTDDERVK